MDARCKQMDPPLQTNGRPVANKEMDAPLKTNGPTLASNWIQPLKTNSMIDLVACGPLGHDESFNGVNKFKCVSPTQSIQSIQCNELTQIRHMNQQSA